jgi:predicted PurR-regulated permease PerM
VGLGIMGQVDNVVRPLLLSGKAQLSTLVLIISLMGGVSAFGLIGIVLGPLVASLVTALFESYEASLPGEGSPPASDMAAAAAAPDPGGTPRPQAEAKP